jgi:hypothetical protein
LFWVSLDAAYARQVSAGILGRQESHNGGEGDVEAKA